MYRELRNIATGGEYAYKVVFLKVDVDKHSDFSSNINPSLVPIFRFMKNSEQVIYIYYVKRVCSKYIYIYETGYILHITHINKHW